MEKREFVLLAKVGQVNKNQVEKRETLAREKVWRLTTRNCLRTSLHYSNIEEDKFNLYWRGAVIGSRYAYSFSGLHELLDEAMIAALALKQCDLLLVDILERFNKNNKYLEPFLKHCGLMK